MALRLTGKMASLLLFFPNSDRPRDSSTRAYIHTIQPPPRSAPTTLTHFAQSSPKIWVRPINSSDQVTHFLLRRLWKLHVAAGQDLLTMQLQGSYKLSHWHVSIATAPQSIFHTWWAGHSTPAPAQLLLPAQPCPHSLRLIPAPAPCPPAHAHSGSYPCQLRSDSIIPKSREQDKFHPLTITHTLYIPPNNYQLTAFLHDLHS